VNCEPLTLRSRCKRWFQDSWDGLVSSVVPSGESGGNPPQSLVYSSRSNLKETFTLVR
jgi:hypothetical protein